MSGNSKKQDAKAGLKQRYSLRRWPDSQDAESRWKMKHGNGGAGLPGLVPSGCLPAREASTATSAGQPRATCPPTTQRQPKTRPLTCNTAFSEELK